MGLTGWRTRRIGTLLVPVPIPIAMVLHAPEAEPALIAAICAPLLLIPALLIYARLPAAAALSALPLAGIALVGQADGVAALPGLLILFGVALVDLRNPDPAGDVGSPPQQAAPESLQLNASARVIVAVAALTNVWPAIWLGKVSLGVGFFLFFPALTALPLLCRHPLAFRRACRTVAVLLVVFGVLGVFLLLCFFWAGAALLLVAGHALRAQHRQRYLRLLTTVSGSVCLVLFAVWSVATYQSALAPSDGFVVSFASREAQNRAAAAGTGDTSGSGIGPNIQGISQGDGWNVYFRDGISDPELATLRGQLQRIPGVTEVHLCSRWNGEC